MKMASKFVVQRKRATCLTTNESKACLSRYDNGAYSRMQFMSAVSHSMGAHMEALCLTADSSSDEDKRMRRQVATTSESSESAATDPTVLMFALKGKYNKKPSCR